MRAFLRVPSCTCVHVSQRSPPTIIQFAPEEQCRSLGPTNRQALVRVRNEPLQHRDSVVSACDVRVLNAADDSAACVLGPALCAGAEVAGASGGVGGCEGETGSETCVV